MANYNLQGSTPLGMVANTTVAQFAMVKQHSVEGEAVVTTAITDIPLGAAMIAGTAGSLLAIQQRGRAKCIAGAAISLGAQLMCAAAGGGKVETAAGATALTIGKALQAAGADGDIIEVDLLIGGNAPAST